MATLDPAALNKMISARIRDVAKRRVKETDPHLAEKLRRAMGLHPAPPRTPLSRQDFGEIQQAGFKIEKLAYQSRPGFVVPASLYRPDGESKGALLFAADAAWSHGKSAPAAQAFGVSMALRGFTTLVIEAPGRWYAGVENERSSQGDAWEGTTKMGAPALGQYVWDIIRGLDLLAETLSTEKVGVAGCGVGAEAALLAFAIDSRAASLVSACAAGSHELTPRLPESLCQLAGIAELGDVGDWLAARAGAPVLFLACDEDKVHTAESVQKTADKAKTRMGSGANVRFAHFLGEPDFNRRMREVAGAFFLEHLTGTKFSEYDAEPRPITDGQVRPFPAETLEASQLDLFAEPSPGTPYSSDVAPTTLRAVAEKLLAEPYPEESPALIPWGDYGHIPGQAPTETIKLVDGPAEIGSISLPSRELDLDGLNALGLSVPEFLGQILHLWLPGHPETMASVAAKGDPLSNVVASVRNLVKKDENKVELNLVQAEGLVASLTAQTLAAYRTGIEVKSSHSDNDPLLILGASSGVISTPGARYRKA